MPRSSKLRSLGLFLLAPLLSVWFSLSPALADPLSEIEAQYQKTYRAAALKYRYGMYSHRASGFTAVDADGVAWAPKKEKAWIESFLSKALSVKETGKVLSFSRISDSEAECEVLDRLEAVIVTDPVKRLTARAVLVTRSADRWRLTRQGWRQSGSRVLDQSYSETQIEPKK